MKVLWDHRITRAAFYIISVSATSLPPWCEGRCTICVRWKFWKTVESTRNVTITRRCPYLVPWAVQRSVVKQELADLTTRIMRQTGKKRELLQWFETLDSDVMLVVCWQSIRLLVMPLYLLSMCDRKSISMFICLTATCHFLCFNFFTEAQALAGSMCSVIRGRATSDCTRLF